VPVNELNVLQSFLQIWELSLILLLEYNFTGAAMEVNISHRSKQEILSTSNLARLDLFQNALNEIIQLMRTVSFLGSTQF